MTARERLCLVRVSLFHREKKIRYIQGHHSRKHHPRLVNVLNYLVVYFGVKRGWAREIPDLGLPRLRRDVHFPLRNGEHFRRFWYESESLAVRVTHCDLNHCLRRQMLRHFRTAPTAVRRVGCHQFVCFVSHPSLLKILGGLRRNSHYIGQHYATFVSDELLSVHFFFVCPCPEFIFPLNSWYALSLSSLYFGMTSL